MIDHGAVADLGADAEIALDQRRQGVDRRAGVDRLLGDAIHRGVAVRQRADAPFLGGEAVVVEEGERQGEAARVGALEAGAADHHVDAVAQDIGPDALPQEFDGALAAIFRQHAGAAELEEGLARLGVEERLEIVFAGGIEAVGAIGDRLAQHAIGADDLGPRLAEGLGLEAGVIEYQDVVADGIEGVGVAAGHHGAGVGDGRHFLIEDAITQFLRALHLADGASEAHLEIADAAERGLVRRADEAADRRGYLETRQHVEAAGGQPALRLEAAEKSERGHRGTGQGHRHTSSIGTRPSRRPTFTAKESRGVFIRETMPN